VRVFEAGSVGAEAEGLDLSDAREALVEGFMF
jgi:hypothetical protein